MPRVFGHSNGFGILSSKNEYSVHFEEEPKKRYYAECRSCGEPLNYDESIENDGYCEVCAKERSLVESFVRENYKRC